MSGYSIIVSQSPVSVSDRVQCIRGWCAVCGVTGTSSVQFDCLWKELVSQSTGVGTADGNSESSHGSGGWSLMVLRAFLTHHLV
jgi:hypothetical protein